jgi:hypothetical protein
VNWLPWSALKISGLPFLSASFQGLDAEIRVQCVGEPPGEHVAGVPVDDGYQVEESSGHEDIGDVRHPDMVRPCYPGAAEQGRIDFMVRRRLSSTVVPVDGLEPHHAHQPMDAFPGDALVLPLQPRGDLEPSCIQIL